jgi:hypothetical protein
LTTLPGHVLALKKQNGKAQETHNKDFNFHRILKIIDFITGTSSLNFYAVLWSTYLGFLSLNILMNLELNDFLSEL